MEKPDQNYIIDELDVLVQRHRGAPIPVTVNGKNYLLTRNISPEGFIFVSVKTAGGVNIGAVYWNTARKEWLHFVSGEGLFIEPVSTLEEMVAKVTDLNGEA